jgi:ankyrin repeat protein
MHALSSKLTALFKNTPQQKPKPQSTGIRSSNSASASPTTPQSPQKPVILVAGGGLNSSTITPPYKQSTPPTATLSEFQRPSWLSEASSSLTSAHLALPSLKQHQTSSSSHDTILSLPPLKVPVEDASMIEARNILIAGHINLSGLNSQDLLLFAAALTGNHTKIAELSAIKSINLNHQNADGVTALHLAAQGGHVLAAETLIKAGVIELPDRDGNTPFMWSLIYQKMPTFISLGINLDGDAVTALLTDSTMGSLINDMMQTFKADAANHTLYTFGSVLSKFEGALQNLDEFKEIVGQKWDAALDKARVVLNDKFIEINGLEEADIILFATAYKGDITGMKEALLFGANPNTLNSVGSTPLHVVAQHPEPESMIMLLINNQADVDSVGYNGNTPLHLAVKFGTYTAVYLLLMNGAKHDTVNDNQETPVALILTSSSKEKKLALECCSKQCMSISTAYQDFFQDAELCKKVFSKIDSLDKEYSLK